MIVGRAAELDRLTELVSDLARDAGFALLVSGDAGMGKSTLLDVLARSTDVRVLRASGVVAESQIAFAGLHELLAPALAEIEQLPERPRTALRQCLGLEPGRTDEIASFVALTMFLTTLAADRPVLCLVDDTQWLDESSVDALLFAARRHPPRVGFVFAARAEATAQLAQPWLPAISLAALDDADSRALLARCCPTLTATETERVLAASDGCPLALVEFGGAAARGGPLPVAGPLPISERLEAAFGATVRALPDATKRALLVLAAADTDSALIVGRAVEAFTGDRAALDPAIDAGVVTSSAAAVRFRHPLVRAAAYHSASRSAQRAAHRVLADVLAADEPERAAWHRADAADSPDEDVAAALVQTADMARRRGGYAAESRALERAARLTPDGELRTARLAAAAASALQAGKHQQAQSLLREVVSRAQDPIVLADAEHDLAQLAFWHDGRRLRPSADTVAKVAAVDRQRAARLLSYDLVSLISDYQVHAALPIALRSRELIGDGLEPFEVSFRVAHVLIMGGRTAEGAELTARLADAAERAGNLIAAVNVAQPCIWLERYEQARRLLESAATALRAVDALWMLGHALVARAELERRVGALTTAHLAAAEALALAEQLGEPMQEAEALVQLAAVEAALGRPVECAAHAQRAERLAQSRECGKGELLALGAAARGSLALAAGRAAEAVGWLSGPVNQVIEGGVADPAVAPYIADLVEAYAQAGRVPDAEQLLDWLAGQADRCERRWAQFAALRAAVLLHDSPDARDRLLAALQADGSLPRVQAGRGWLVLGSAQRRTGQRAEARAALHRAHELFAAAGAQAWTERAANELRASGATVGATRRDPRNTLTPQEARVARLVAGGARNREVAASLFVTAKTVETHLAAVYRKLGVRTRAELAARLAAAETDDGSQGFA